MIRPPKLERGDGIRIVAPARKISLAELQPAIEQIEAWGLQVLYSEKLFAQEHQFAGSDAIRIADFQEAIDDPHCKAILCARGGYGSVRIIDSLDFSSFKQRPKWIIGYSDVTVFHSALHGLGFASLHASMPIDFHKNSLQGLKSLKQAISGSDYRIEAPANSRNKVGSAKAPIVGGNLSILYSLLGSRDSIDTKGKILFLEDLDEYLYHVDRMMFNLKRNNYFDEAAGIIVGALSDMNDNSIPFGESAADILNRHFQDLSIPIAYDIPAGHLNDNQALIFGIETELKVDSHGSTISFSHEESQSRSGR